MTVVNVNIAYAILIVNDEVAKWTFDHRNVQTQKNAGLPRFHWVIFRVCSDLVQSCFRFAL